METVFDFMLLTYYLTAVLSHGVHTLPENDPAVSSAHWKYWTEGRKKFGYLTAMLAAILMATLTACGSAGTAQEATQPYDYYIDCTTREQLVALADEDFVEDIFRFSLLQFSLPDNGTGRERRLMLLATESFDHLDTSSFARQMYIAEDPAILQSPDRNPILIDEALAKAEGLSIGDTFVLPNCLTEEPVVFTVGAIYRRASLFAQYDAVILCNARRSTQSFTLWKKICASRQRMSRHPTCRV